MPNDWPRQSPVIPGLFSDSQQTTGKRHTPSKPHVPIKCRARDPQRPANVVDFYALVGVSFFGEHDFRFLGNHLGTPNTFYRRLNMPSRRRPHRFRISSRRPHPQPVFFFIPTLLRQRATSVPSCNGRRFLASCFDSLDRFDTDGRTGRRSLSARASAPPQRA